MAYTDEMIIATGYMLGMLRDIINKANEEDDDDMALMPAVKFNKACDQYLTSTAEFLSRKPSDKGKIKIDLQWWVYDSNAGNVKFPEGMKGIETGEEFVKWIVKNYG